MSGLRTQRPPPRPFVTANFAITADGRISTRNFTPSDFSSPHDKRRLLEIRAACDAVLVGARTLAADTMTLGVPANLTTRAPGKNRVISPPLRVVVSNSGRISPSLRIFRKAGAPIIIFSTRRMPTSTRAALAAKADLYIHGAATVKLAPALAILREDYGVKRLVCEGGGSLLRSFAAAGLLDEIHLTVCPRFFGGRGAPTLTGLPSSFLPAAVELRLVEMLPAGEECFTRWRVIRRDARLVEIAS